MSSNKYNIHMEKNGNYIETSYTYTTVQKYPGTHVGLKKYNCNDFTPYNYRAALKIHIPYTRP